MCRKRSLFGGLLLAVAEAASILATVTSARRASATPPSAAATAQDPGTEEARRWVKVATAEYTRTNWQAALEAYLKAWNAKQHFTIAANLADVEYRLGRYSDAATHLRFFIAHLPPEYAEQRVSAEQRLGQCQSHLIAVRVKVNVPGATVLLDGVELGHEPLAEELWLEPGAHSLEAESPGYLGARRDFDAALGESREVFLVLALPRPQARVQSQPVAQRPLVREAPSSGMSPRTWALVGGGALTAVAVGVSLAYAMSSGEAERRLQSRRRAVESHGNAELALAHSSCSASPNTQGCSALASLRDERDDARFASGIAFIGAGVTGSLTLATYLFWPVEGAKRKTSGEAASGHLAPLRVSAAPKFAGVEWRGAF
jgi:tetratricopeptide (TPR) repeat protein